ncbi:hypothetical protein [Angustibacter sp. Root456]|uniref:hypothetical protein n=1 Tax=Angustibacter sp. Root456 TaxID=1736539 RepID=UPI0006FC1C8D|nr:hypothetical protein [Angustibacter sp. Root456]KQX61845.1 hypothetical protein ASD06_14910 [Angustibacter sp. Root456]
MHATRLLTVCVLSAGLALTACSGTTKDEAKGGNPSPTSTAAGSPSAATSVDPQKNGSAEAGVGLEALDHPIASVTAKTGMQKDPTATVKVDLLGLKRKEKLVVLTAAVTPTTTLSDPQSLFRVLGSNSWRPSLIDTVNLKQYSVVRADGRILLSNDLVVRAGSGQPMFVYAVFAAPPPEVTKVNVLFSDAIPAFSDVPIQ